MIKEKLIDFKKKATKRHVVWSIIISLALLFVSYVAMNTSIPLPNEMGVLQWNDKLKAVCGLNKDNIPNEVLLVNVGYDKQLVDYYDPYDPELNIPLGQYAITDRQKLLDFLLLAQNANNYRYILLDIIFERGLASPQDSALFHLISNMDRIAIAAHKDILLQDSILYKKSAIADYTITWKETNFSRFKFLWNGMPTIPLKMYEELDRKKITKHGILYTSNNSICQNGLTLQLPIRVTATSMPHRRSSITTKDLGNEGGKVRLNVVQLGADLLASDTIFPISNEINNKIVVIGDFTENDMHDTYAGSMPGPIVCLNAYYALKRGDHIIGGWRLFFYLIIMFVYFVMALCYLCHFSINSLAKKEWLKKLLSIIKIGGIFFVIGIIGYVLFDTVYNFWIPIIFFTALKAGIDIHSLIKNYKNEKIKNDIALIDPAVDKLGGKLQGSIHEQSTN